MNIPMQLLWPGMKEDLEKLLVRIDKGERGFLFGYRTNPINGFRQFHSGIDVPKPTGTPIRLPWDGYVVRAWFDPKVANKGNGGGNSIIVRHPSKDVIMHSTGYCHLLAFSPKTLENYHKNHDNEGTLLDDPTILPAGTVLGQVDTTGDSTGPHLHFTCRRVIARKLQTTDPLPFLLEAVGIDVPFHKVG